MQAIERFEAIYQECFGDREPDQIRKYYAWLDYRRSIVAEGFVSEEEADDWDEPEGC